MSRCLFAVLAITILLLSPAACSAPPPQPALAEPTPTQPAATPLPPTATPVPPSPTPLPPTPTPAPSVPSSPAAGAAGRAIPATPPDPQQDPLGALLYASSGNSWRSATFTYTMDMKLAPVDAAAAKALGPAADQLAQVAVKGTGSGAMQIVDPGTGKANMQMTMDLSAGGTKTSVELVAVNGNYWTRMGAGGAWQKVSPGGTGGRQIMPGGDPANMLESLRKATNVTWVDSKPVDGEAMHHVRFTVDPGQMDPSALAGAAGGLLPPEEARKLMQDATIEVDVWLTARDLLLRQEQMRMVMPMPSPRQGAGIAATIGMMMRFADFDKPVDISAPEK